MTCGRPPSARCCRFSSRVFFTQAFEGAYFDQGQLIAKFPQREPEASRVYQFDPSSKDTKKLYELDANEKRIWQEGPILVKLRPEKENQKDSLFLHGDSIMEVRNVRDNTLLWEKKIGKAIPRFFCSGEVLTLLIGNWDSMKAAAKEDPALSNALNALNSTNEKRDAYILEAYEVATGKRLGAVLVDTGKLSFRVRWAVTFGDTVLVADSHNRTLVYSLKTGQQRGKVPGYVWAISGKSDRMLVEMGQGMAEIYDMNTLQPVAHLSFPARLSEAQFTRDGTLLVLTSDQTVYQLKTDDTTQANASPGDGTK